MAQILLIILVFLFTTSNYSLASKLIDKHKNIYRTQCEKSSNEINLLPGFEDKSFIIEISDFGGGYIAMKIRLYNKSNCKSSWFNKAEYFEIKNYIILTKNIRGLINHKKSIDLVNSTLWMPGDKIMELITTNETVAAKLILPKRCGKLKANGEVVIISKDCMTEIDFDKFKKHKDFFPGTFLALQYDNDQDRLLLLENKEDNCKDERKCIVLYKKEY